MKSRSLIGVHRSRRAWPLPRSAFANFFVTVVVVQGIHVFEHVVQLIQVYDLGIPEDNALGLLGYVFQFQGTEEWLHLVFNVSYLLALYALLLPLRRSTLDGHVPAWAFWVFALGAVGLETWHFVEHVVIISNVVRNNGCPCPGIGDAALGVTDVVLHFLYNVITYAALLPAFWFTLRGGRAKRPLSFAMRGM
jgi:hypothetical protein